MPTLHLLGTGAPISDPYRTITMLALNDRNNTVIIDCGGDPIQRMLASGLDPNTISALILTHEHIDHVNGFPLFMEKLWLLGRSNPIPVYGIAPALDQARRCFDTFDTSRWTGKPEIHWREVPHRAGALVVENDLWKITAAPGCHSVPVIGLHVEAKSSGGTVGYSGDTEPAETILRLVTGVDLLLHEATGKRRGHSSAAEAAEIAKRAGVNRLVLVHVSPDLTESMLEDVRSLFGAVTIGQELAIFEL